MIVLSFEKLGAGRRATLSTNIKNPAPERGICACHLSQTEFDTTGDSVVVPPARDHAHHDVQSFCEL